MSEREPPQVRVPSGYAWHGQFRHLLLLAALLPGAHAIASPVFDGGQWLGIDERVWFWIAIAVPIAQQIGVVVVWRAELCYRLVSRIFGKAGFVLWGVYFLPLLVARPLGILAVGLADRGSLGLDPLLTTALGCALLVPAAWGMHSVQKYFGIPRAIGGDHFYEHYRAMPFVREGAFKYSSNAMYAIVFLGFWGIALLTGSQAALAVAFFQHAYIWVHWYCTEQPDGVVLYGRSPDED